MIAYVGKDKEGISVKKQSACHGAEASKSIS